METAYRPDEVTHLHETNLGRLLTYTRVNVVEEYESAHPWVRAAWEHVLDTEGGLVIDYTSLGSRVVRHCNAEENELLYCTLGVLYMSSDHVEDPFVIVHELAHVYTLVNKVVDNPLPAAVGMIYFEQLVKSGVLADGCTYAHEYYADLLATAVTGIDSSNYWRTCNPDFQEGQADALTQSILPLIRDVSAYNTPAWFDDVTLEEAWTTMLGMGWKEFDVTAYMLRNQFGGYCDETIISLALFRDYRLTNPWRDSGCQPSAPQNLRAVAGDNEISVSWDAPETVGGASLDNYRFPVGVSRPDV